MVDITAKKAKGKGKGYEKWATLHNLKQMAATMSIYEESGFSSPEELEAALAAASAELSNVHAELKAVESTLREKKDLQKQLLAYIKTKPARDGLKAQKTEKARKNYREQRKIEFIIAEAATRFLMLMYGKEASNRKQEIDRQGKVINVESGDESGIAAVSADGQYIVTCAGGDSPSGTLRAYQVSDGTKVADETYTMDTNCKPYEIWVIGHSAYAALGTDDGYALSQAVDLL